MVVISSQPQNADTWIQSALLQSFPTSTDSSGNKLFLGMYYVSDCMQNIFKETLFIDI